MPSSPIPFTALTPAENTLCANGASISLQGDVERVPGPVPGMLGIRGIGGGDVVLDLPTPLSGQGTLAYWLRSPVAVLNGHGTQRGGPTFCTVPGLLRCNLWWYQGYCQFNFHFEDGPNHEIQLPGVPGPQWMHFCLTWDADAGLLQVFVNGTPTRLPGVMIPAWQTGESTSITLPVGAWALADVRLYDRPLTSQEAESLVPPLYRGALDGLIGAQPRGLLDLDGVRGDQLYANALDFAGALAGWRMEGPGIMRIDNGWMHLESTEPNSKGQSGHIVYWCDQEFPADFLAEFDIQPETELGLVILFFCARGCQDEDIFDSSLKERSGIFGHYTNSDINCYHVSYYANTPDAGRGRCTSNLRKNSGFWLVDQGPIGIPPGSRDIHHIAVLKAGSTIEVAVDGRRVIRWFDPGDRYGSVLGAGKIGFRQMKWMQARYRNFRVSALK